MIRARLTVEEDAGAGELDLSGKLRIQVCDADSCYPPEQVPIAVAVTVIGEDVRALKQVLSRPD